MIGVHAFSYRKSARKPFEKIKKNQGRCSLESGRVIYAKGLALIAFRIFLH